MVAADDIVRSLGIEPGQSVAAVGGGGKTSLLTAIAREFHAQSGKPAILTTTTKIFAPLPEEEIHLALGDAATLSKNLRSYMDACGVSWFARRREGKSPVPGRESERRMKLSGFMPSEIARFTLGNALTLIEADGARRLPIKASGPGEPVLPENIDAVLGVVGLDALGAPLSEAHVFRPDALGRICGLEAGEEITAESVGKLSTHPDGLFHKVDDGARKWIVINKADLGTSLEKLEKTAYTIWELAGKPCGPADGILFTSCKNNECEVILRIMPDA
ncbi:MAG: putative selenium-dependent hydroxylase accessory protein YqeC [Nitrospinae bacterium]|nr:putative selenium-dependent hydroxylase accessory protein YqeC [Nitrospinota bacterium]